MSFLKNCEFPTPRSGAVVFAYKNQMMVWGGMTQIILGKDDGRFLVSIDLPEESNTVLEILDLCTYEWQREKTSGDIPFMGKSLYHILVDDTLFLFGGVSRSYHNQLYKLSLLNYQWEKVSPSSISSIPSPMCEGGSVRHGTSMFVYGGKGNPLPHSNSSHGATFKSNLNFGYLCDDGWHNALYEYNFVDNTWMEAGLTGDDRPPPCSRFSFNKIDSHRALMFGGKQDKYKVTYGDVYILDLDSQMWEKHSFDTDRKWPKPRGFHVANCLVDPESDEAKDEQYVIVFWGQGADARHVPDIWILHIQSITWREFRISSSFELKPRMFFSSCSNHIQTKQTDVVVFGGNKQRKDKFDRNVMTNPLIIRFGSVKRLDQTCICVLKGYFKSLDKLSHFLPFKLQIQIKEHNEYTPLNNHNPIVIYPLENNFMK